MLMALFGVVSLATKVILHAILPGVGGSIYTSHTLNHLKKLGLDVQKAHKTALKLHARSVLYAHKLTTTRRALQNSSCFQGLGREQGAACHPPDPHWFILQEKFSLVEETHGSSGQCVSFSLIDVGSGFTVYVIFLFLFFPHTLVPLKSLGLDSQ